MTTPELEDITPERALELIQKASVNYVGARLDGRRVAQYARLMVEGEWQVTPDCEFPLADGKLVDGLNRLMAIVLSGTTQKFMVTDASLIPTDLGWPAWHSGPRLCDLQGGPTWMP